MYPFFTSGLLRFSVSAIFLQFQSYFILNFKWATLAKQQVEDSVAVPPPWDQDTAVPRAVVATLWSWFGVELPFFMLQA